MRRFYSEQRENQMSPLTFSRTTLSENQLHKNTIHPEEDLENQSLISFLSFGLFHVR